MPLGGMQVVEHVAGYLGLDATLVRERNFMYPKDLPAHPYAPPTPKPQVQAPKAANPDTKIDTQNCNGKADRLDAHSQSKGDSHDVKGGKEMKGSSSKSHTTPDVVCGRFQIKEPGVEASQASVTSSGRYVFAQLRKVFCCVVCCCRLACHLQPFPLATLPTLLPKPPCRAVLPQHGQARGLGRAYTVAD